MFQVEFVLKGCVETARFEVVCIEKARRAVAQVTAGSKPVLTLIGFTGAERKSEVAQIATVRSFVIIRQIGAARRARPLALTHVVAEQVALIRAAPKSPGGTLIFRPVEEHRTGHKTVVERAV